LTGYTELVTVRGISKRFYGTQALDEVSIAFRSGQVHALIGENGAGKSTLIKILGGVHQPDSGSAEIDGRSIDFSGPRDALEAGIVVIPQEMRVVMAQTVAENVLLGKIPTKKTMGFLPVIDRRSMRETTQELLGRFDLNVDPDTTLDRLSFAERQLIMIARALNHDARLLILDEPTAALETREVERLFDFIERLKSHNVAIVFVSHRLDEVERIADECTILRDGRVVEHRVAGVPQRSEMIRLMTGRDLEELHHSEFRQKSTPILEIEYGENASGSRETVTVHSGEILGLAGLLGGGMTEFLSHIFGAKSGETRLRLKGQEVTIKSPNDAIRLGIGLVPSERSHGLIFGLTVRENIVLPNIDKFAKYGTLNRKKIDAFVEELIAALDIRPNDPHKEVRELSGGNQQKVIFARWLAGHSDVLLLDEPTHGIDVGAKALVHKLMNDFADDGRGIVFASSEMTEVLSISDTVMAMRTGEFVGRFSREGEYNEKVLRDALGG